MAEHLGARRSNLNKPFPGDVSISQMPLYEIVLGEVVQKAGRDRHRAVSGRGCAEAVIPEAGDSTPGEKGSG